MGRTPSDIKFNQPDSQKETKMPANKCHKTKYQGVYYIDSTSFATGKPERVYYNIYRKDGKLIIVTIIT